MNSGISGDISIGLTLHIDWPIYLSANFFVLSPQNGVLKPAERRLFPFLSRPAKPAGQHIDRPAGRVPPGGLSFPGRSACRETGVADRGGRRQTSLFPAAGISAILQRYLTETPALFNLAGKLRLPRCGFPECAKHFRAAPQPRLFAGPPAGRSAAVRNSKFFGEVSNNETHPCGGGRPGAEHRALL